jgi:hypothetical protein
MKTASALVALMIGCLVAGCTTNQTASRLGWIRVSPDKRGFVDTQTGRTFKPWGFNYDRDYKMRLLEDYWETEWPTVEEDFREMKVLGANVVRIHLQLAKFMTAPDQPNEKALARLGKILQFAEETGLYLDLTGLACYRKADVPAWFDALSEAERWKAQANFWRAIAKTCAGSPAVFCYDLINEPVAPATPRKPNDWLVGELAGFYYVQAIALDPAGRAPHEIARQWATQMVAAIREQDRRHLITVGFLPNSGAQFVRAASPPLDFVCVHIYPRSGEMQQARETLADFRVGKPLVVEELFPLACRGEELVEFIRDPQTEVAGWVSFYWGQTLEELAVEKTISAAMIRAWLELFQGHGVRVTQ